MQRVGDDIPLTDAQLRSHANAYAEIAAGIAGRSRIVTELVEGRSAVDGEAACIGRNPQGGIGCDLSGPPWGSALRMTIATISGRKPNNATSADHRTPLGTCSRANVNGLVVPVQVGPWPVWNRPFEKLPEPYKAPHSRGYLTIRAYASGVQSTSVKCSAWNTTLGQTGSNGGQSKTQTLSLTATEKTFDLGMWVDLAPGRNWIRLLFICETNNQSFEITSLLIEQRAKRTH